MTEEAAALGLRWQKARIVGEIALAVSGFALTAVLAAGEWQDRRQEASRKADDDQRAQEDRYTRQFQSYYEMARNARIDDQFALADLDLASAMAQTLAGEPFSKPFYNDAVLALRARYPSPPGGQKGAPTLSAVRLQSEEASTGTNVGLSTEEWFAVIATYSGNPEGRRLAVQRRDDLRQVGCVEVWRTKIGRKYAVVLGGKVSRAMALSLAQRARNAGLAQDAFTQANREWTQEASCT